MQITLLIIFLILTVLNAVIDANKIATGKPIYHATEYLIFLGLCIAVSFACNWIFHEGVNWFILIVAAIVGSTVTRTAFFNFILNKLRGLPLSFESTSTSSGIDQLEEKLGINQWIVSVIFISIWTVLLFIKII